MQENSDNAIICLRTKNFSSNRVVETLEPLNIFFQKIKSDAPREVFVIPKFI